MMSENVELKLCPFCGGQNIDILKESPSLGDLSFSFYAFVCDIRKGGCGASSGYYLTLEKAIEAWNRRADNGISVN